MTHAYTHDDTHTQNNIDSISNEEANMVKLMIPGGPEQRRQAPEEKVWLACVCSNRKE